MRELLRKFKNIKKTTIKSNEIYLTFKSNFEEVCYCYLLSEINFKKLKSINKDFERRNKIEVRKTNNKKLIENYCNTITKKEYLTQKEFTQLLEKFGVNNIVYYFDFLGWIEDFKITNKGFTAIDGTNTKSQFNTHSNKDFKFYKNGIVLFS